MDFGGTNATTATADCGGLVTNVWMTGNTPGQMGAASRYSQWDELAGEAVHELARTGHCLDAMQQVPKQFNKKTQMPECDP